MKTIMCYGDSNTRGYIPGSFDEAIELSRRYDKNNRWTGILQNMLGGEFVIVEEGLNGRTTAFDEDDTGRLFRNGLASLPLYLESHYPIDLVILVMGTNDTKIEFNKSAKEITEGMRKLVTTVKNCDFGLNGQAPKILIVSPQPILRGYHDEYFDESSILKSEALSREYQRLAEQEQCEYLDASLFVSSSIIDSVHLDETNHQLLANVIKEKVLKILS